MTLAGAATGRKASSDLHALERGFEIVDVALQLGLPGIFDRPDADRFRGGGDAFVRVELGVELGKPRAVGAALERIGGVALDRPALEAGQPLEHVLRPARSTCRTRRRSARRCRLRPAGAPPRRRNRSGTSGRPSRRKACRPASARRKSCKACGRIRLPTWVVRMRSVLCFMSRSMPAGDARNGNAWAAAP